MSLAEDSEGSRNSQGLNGWWKLVVGVLIGAIAPSLIAWGSMSAKIDNNAEQIKTKVEIKTFEEYKKGNTSLLQRIDASLLRIENKIDKQIK